MVYDLLRSELKKRKYRMTVQREAVLRVFMESDDKHLGAEDVYRILLGKKYRISKATVYRTIELLTDLGFLRKLDFGDGMYRYEIVERDNAYHQHLICKECGRIVEINDELVKELIERLEKETGFSIDTHDIKFYGVCSKCKRKMRKSKHTKMM
ncbi:MAG: transcriptional repressor [Thermotoga sp. 4484_232]|nr:transcriptional repressor [Thermotogaceae bacterium]OQX58423.1 MAG: transcriptional repressor [Thermotoga sp. 4484_232]RKX39170.1 MAG: transcriptional repressor [Thermotogota bacterium]RKX55298.1 MAG: transcriptional repressor [Thermotoga sp.]HDG62347.1 transcriptional repressor [Thermotoga sp.]